MKFLSISQQPNKEQQSTKRRTRSKQTNTYPVAIVAERLALGLVRARATRARTGSWGWGRSKQTMAESAGLISLLVRRQKERGAEGREISGDDVSSDEEEQQVWQTKVFKVAIVVPFAWKSCQIRSCALHILRPPNILDNKSSRRGMIDADNSRKILFSGKNFEI